MGRMTVISGAERRRRWSDEDRTRILAATFEPGAVIAEVARREDVCTSLVFKWRREMRQAAEADTRGFAPVVIEPAPAALSSSTSPSCSGFLSRGAGGGKSLFMSQNGHNHRMRRPWPSRVNSRQVVVSTSLARRGDEVYTIANLPKEMFAGLNENPKWARALGYALDQAHIRGRDSGIEEGAAGAQRAIRRALGLN